MIKRKGQAGGIEISILIMLIAFFIIIYIVLLPPGERGALLNETTTTLDSGVSAAAKTLLSASPGKVYPYTTSTQENKLESMHLFSKDSTEQESLAKAITISKSLLKDDYKNLYFDVKDLKDATEVSLVFLIKKSQGDITLSLNGNTIYEGTLTNKQLPLKLPSAYLKSKNNVLHMETESPGIKIFSANYYLLQDIKLVKKMQTKKLSSIRVFSVDSNQDVNNLKLSYFINCNKLKDSGKLTILFNDKVEHSDTIFCQYSEKRELILDKKQLSNTGRNKLEFKIDKGDYNIDQAIVKVRMAKSSYPKYSLDIDSSTWADIRAGKKKVKIRFTLGGERAKAQITVQEKQFSINTQSTTYTKDITTMLDNGANHITLVPYTTFDLKNIKVYVG